MASYNPPSEQLPIFDNEVFSNNLTGSTVLTVAQANLLYLRKTFADTATALETFTAGIKSSFIDPLTTNGTITISSASSPASTINIGVTGAPQTLNINRPIQLQYFKSSITSSALGYNVISPSSSGPTGMSAGVTTNLATLTITQGVWVLFGTCTSLLSGVPSVAYFQLSIGTGSSLDYTACSTTLVFNGIMTFQVTRYHSSDSGATYYLLANSQFTTNAENIKFNAYRIG